jgi:tRNA G46 methylase TrmB
MESPKTSYDVIRYPGVFHPQSSHERLATIATLYGIQPAPIDNCRVLELGCGDGANLIPLAQHFPGSSFVGIDQSSSAIEHGRRIINSLGDWNKLGGADTPLQQFCPNLGIMCLVARARPHRLRRREHARA